MPLLRRIKRLGMLSSADRRLFIRASIWLGLMGLGLRALVLHRWLRQAGLPSELRVGVRKDGRELKARALVELEGQVVNDWPESVAEFTPMASPRAAQLGASVWGVW